MDSSRLQPPASSGGATQSTNASAAWDPVWDRVFSDRAWGKYPPEELVAFVGRTFGKSPDRKAIRILELGCGPGANLWFLAREGYRTDGIDGSAVAIEQARARLASEKFQAELSVGDLAALPYPDASFQAVVDIAAVQHNRNADQKRILAEARRVLAPGGKGFFMLMATGSWGEGEGVMVEPGTFTEITSGPASGCGLIHFFTEGEIEKLFEPFSAFDYERRERTLMSRQRKIVTWLVTATK